MQLLLVFLGIIVLGVICHPLRSLTTQELLCWRDHMERPESERVGIRDACSATAGLAPAIWVFPVQVPNTWVRKALRSLQAQPPPDYSNVRGPKWKVSGWIPSTSRTMRENNKNKWCCSCMPVSLRWFVMQAEVTKRLGVGWLSMALPDGSWRVPTKHFQVAATFLLWTFAHSFYYKCCSRIGFLSVLPIAKLILCQDPLSGTFLSSPLLLPFLSVLVLFALQVPA